MQIDFLFAPRLPSVMQLGIAVSVTLIVASVLYFTYRRIFRTLPRMYAWIISTSKLLAALLLLILIFQPVLKLNDSESFDRTVLFMFDTSESMGIKDSVGNSQRLQAVVRRIDETGIKTKIEDSFNIRSYSFNSFDSIHELKNMKELSGIIPGGKYTQINQSAQKILQKSGDDKVSAIVIFSDGVENSPDFFTNKRLGTSIFTVGVGSTPDENPFFQDIAIDAEASGQIIAGNKTEIKVFVRISGDKLAQKYKALPVTLKSEDETIEGLVEFTDNSKTAELTLFAKPMKVGRTLYVVSVPVDDAESITANNSKEIDFRVNNPKIRVLYLEGFPRYEFKGIVSVLSADPNVELTSLINYGSGSYTALGKVVKGIDLSKGLPQKLVEYENFDIVILGDLLPTDLTENQQNLLKTWVIDGITLKDKRRHGNLLFLGGSDSLSGNWVDSPLAELMPVELPSDTSLLTSGPYFVEISRAGLLNSICKGIPAYFRESDKLRSFKKLNGFGRIKPAAESLIKASDKEGNLHHVLVVQTAGGKIAVNGLLETWKPWSFSLGSKGGKTLFTVFWGQLIRWLAGTTEETVTDAVTIVLPVEKLEPGTNFDIRVIVKDKQNKFVDNAQIVATVKTPQKQDVELVFRPTGMPGQYSAQFLPQFMGKYQIQCSALVEGIKIGGDTSVFNVGQELSEFYKIGIDRSYLKELAARNTGKYFNLVTLEKLPEALQNAFKHDEAHSRSPEYSMNMPLFILFVLLLSTEWFIRRKLHII